MSKYIFSILIALLTLPAFAQQQVQAKAVLDKTATAFEKAGGVKLEFSIQTFHKGRAVGQSTGVLQLKGEKFVLKTPEATTWFDGRTQWSYLTQSDEVNISTPTPEELQSINPYALLRLYQKGFSYKLGPTQTFRGKSVYEVILTATGQHSELSRMVLYTTKETYQPVSILVENRDQGKSEITVTHYQAGLKYADSLFSFNKKHYPRAEIIDLR